MKLLRLVLCSFAILSLALAQPGDPDLAKLSKQRSAARAAYAKNPKNASARKKFVQSNDKYAYATMMSDKLSPKEKYTGALRLYRESYKVDPSDKDAKHWIDQIEAIYRSMNRPIPK